MRTKLLGSILLIIGTSIGGGMLALPISTSEVGFINSSLLLLACWLIMTMSAFLILEANLWLPKDSNMISMAKITLGTSGKWIAWITYLLLLYSLLAAYIAGGGDFLKNLFNVIHIHLPSSITSIIFAGILGYIVSRGIGSIDGVNRILMFIKLAIFILLIGLITPHISATTLSGGEFHYVTASITVALTSFGFATIVPSLRAYFQDDIKKLHLSILIGSLVPLICYILWDVAIMGVIPRNGTSGLISMLHSNRSTSDFINELSLLLNRETITAFARIFTSICLATSFLGVSLSLIDFFADGFKLTKTGKNHLVLLTITFLPPLLIVLFYPGAFIAALSYAGIYCVILLVLLPSLMVWSGRYYKKIAQGYRVIGGKWLLISLIIVSIAIIIQSIMAIIT